MCENKEIPNDSRYACISSVTPVTSVFQVFCGAFNHDGASYLSQTPDARYFFVAATSRCISSIVL